LGLTIQCAQCHSHKYDPISHQDYYALFAFINNCHEASITVFAPEEEAARRATLDRFDKIVSDRLANDGDWLPRLQAWEREIARAPVSDWTPTTLAFDAETIGGQKFLLQDDVSYIAAGYAPTKFHPTADAVVDSLGRITAVRVEMMVDPNLPHGGPGRSIDGTWALSEIELLVPKKDESGNERWQNVAFAGATATIDLPPSPLGARYHDKSDAVRTLGPVNFAIDGDHNTAWHGDRGPGRRNDPQTAMFVLAEPIQAETVTDENGETSARPIRFRVKLVQNHGGWNSDDNQTINLGRFRVSVTSDDVPAIPAQPPRVMATIQKPIHRRDEPESRRVIEAFIRQDAALGDLAAAIDEAWATHPAGTSQLVLAERPVPRETYRLERGDFLSPQEPIAPAIPSLLNPPMPGDAAADDRSAGPPTRLDFALWLASPRNPTTARSIVNRIWQEYFGTGITATSDDLGLQGEPPSHPELLDFLAADLVENGWSLKSLHRRIVLSETYRQDSTITPDRLETDPQNRLLSRGPRVRVPAEMVRDIALAASGLLNREVGGSPVYPPAPDFLFKPPASYGPKTWATSEGADRYRRSLYTFRFRSVPYPVLQAFDAPNGDVSCVRRSVSNTPLQALVTLNEPMFLECAKALADTAISTAAEPEADDDAAITSVFVSCTGRTPNGEELGVLRDLIAQQRERFSQSPEIARQLAGMAPETGDATEKAAWTVLARVVMNLDETITKP
jgi:hypothetical protein